jgi:flagellar biosynthetic protein FlhB
MADNDQSREDRQLEPSARKLQKARAEGQVARSRYLGHLMVLGAGLAGFAAFGQHIGHGALEIVRSGLRFGRDQALDGATLTTWLGASASAAMWIVVPAAALLAVVSVGAAMLPGGPVFTLEPLEPKFDRLDPMAGFGRIFSREALINFAKLTVLAAALVAIAAWFVASRLPEYAGLAGAPLAAALEATRSSLAGGVGMLVALLAAVALVDVPLEWWQHRDRLKMTREEARQELRESEGDPMLKNRMRTRQREIARSRMLAAVPTADVVITNPTHYAVAIRYDEANMGAPRVVAKGADHMAARIRELAMDAGVPLFEAPPLARALYAHVDVDREIPAALYTAVAQVLAYVFQLRHHVPGRTPPPRAPQDLDVPAELDPRAPDATGAAE